MKEVIVFAPLWKKIPVKGYGGIERVTLKRVKHLRLEGYKVQLVANTDERFLADEVINPDKIFRIPKSNLEESLWLLSLKWTNYLSQFSRLGDRLWDAPILSDTSSVDPFNNFFLSRSMGKRRITFILHGNFYFTNGVGKVLIYPVDRLIGASKRLNFGALNTRVSDLLKERGLSCSYMPNGTEFVASPQMIEEPDNYLLFIGAITRLKAPHLAILLSKKLNIPLKIVGPIRDRKYFDSMILPNIRDNIEYLGEIDENILSELRKKAKALIFSSDWNDPQPTVVLEAMSNGVPVLALNLGYYSGIYDMIDNFQNGFVGSMEEVISNAESIFELDRKSVYEKSKAKWSWEFVLRRYHIPVIEGLST
jgi:glycosyltransferase involved in cell wall biosynthesis